MAASHETKLVTFVVAAEEAGRRLDVFLGAKPEVGSRSRAASLLGAGAVSVDGRPRPKSYLLCAGEIVTVNLPTSSSLDLCPEALPVRIVFEDQWLLVVDKPAGMPVHPAPGHPTGTLVNALLEHGLAGGETYRPGIVHRLDKDTTGLLLVAKSAETHRRLVAQMRERTVERHYLALVYGGFPAESGTIEASIGRDPVRRKSMTVGGSGAK